MERYFRLGFAVADQVLVSGASFVTTLLVARFMGAEELGRFVLVWLVVWAVQNVQIALILTPLTTFAPREPEERRAAYYGAVTVHQAVFTAVATILTYVVVLASGYVVPAWRLDALAGPLALVVLFSQVADALRRYFYINERAWISFALDVARYGPQLAGLLALFVLAPNHAGLPEALSIIAASGVLGCLVGWIFVKPFAFDRETTKDVARRHWSFSRWLLGSTLISSARESFVGVSIGGLLGLTEVGALRAVQQLVQITNIPVFVLHNTIPARASRAYGESGFAGMLSYMRGLALRYVGFLGAVLLTVGAFGGPLLALLYGEAYASYGYLVVAYVLITTVFLVRDFVTIIVRTTEKTDADFMTSAVGLGISLALLYPLVHAFGLPGAVLAEACAHVGMLLTIGAGLWSQWKKHTKNGDR
jgi:O-antigen/teichoic acid export membrane protein